MSCPFANRSSTAVKKPLSELPEISLESFQGTPQAHKDSIKMIIFDNYAFDVSTDSSFTTQPLLDYLYQDCTDIIMEMNFKRSQDDSVTSFSELDSFSKMRMKSDMLRLFSEKYNPIARITR